MQLTLFNHVADTEDTTRVVTLSWDQLAEVVSRHDIREHKDGPGFSPVEFHSPHRRVSSVSYVHAIGLDLDKAADGGPLSETQVQEVLEGIKSKGLTYICHTTHSHTHENQAWRVIFPLSRPVTPKEFLPLWRNVMSFLGTPSGIKTDNPARFWYFPSAPPGSDPRFSRFDGSPIDVDSLLNAAPTPTESCPSDPVLLGTTTPELLDKVRESLNTLGPHVKGVSDDNHTFTACALACHDYALDPEEAWPLIQEWNRRNLPPWEEDTLYSKLYRSEGESQRGAARQGFEFLRAAFPEPEKGSFEAEIKQALKDIQEAEGTIKGTNCEPMFQSAEDIVRTIYPTTPWVVRGLIPDGGVGVIATEPKSAKTWCATEIAIAIAGGSKCFGEFDTSPGAVAYYYAEDTGRSVGSRIRALLESREGKVPKDLYCQPRGRDLNICDDDSLSILLASARQLPKLSILILDPFRDVHTGAEDSSDEMSAVMRRLRILGRLLGCTILFVHHSAKSSADTSSRRPGQRMRGSSAIHGACDFGIYLSGLSGNLEDEFTNRVDSEVKAAKGSGTFSLTLNITDGEDGTATKATWEVDTGSVDAAADLDDVFEILKCLRDAELRLEDPPSSNKIRSVVGGRKDNLLKRLRAAEEFGYIKKYKVGGLVKGWELDKLGNNVLDIGE